MDESIFGPILVKLGGTFRRSMLKTPFIMINNKQVLVRCFGLFGLLAAIYFFTYSGTEISTDELKLFDGAHSFFQDGSLELRYTDDLLNVYTTYPVNQIVPSLDTEPLHAYIASILIWIAVHVPNFGLMQTAWTFNIFVTALTAVILYRYGVTLGYRERTAFAIALIFGLATYAWIYSKLFFREPLFTLFLLVCAYSLEKWRRHFDRGQFRVGWLVLALVMLVAAMYTKQALALVVPILLLIAIPGSLGRLLSWRTAIVLVVLVIVAIGAILLYPRLFPGSRPGLFFVRLTAFNFSFVNIASSAYLFGPGYSISTISPVLLLGFPSAYMLLRARRLRQFVVPLALVLIFAIGYAVLQSFNWCGGTGWGSRYMLPLVPFMALWLLPLIERLLDRKLRYWAMAATIGVIALSVFIQFISVSVRVQAYGNYLSAETSALNRPNGLPVAPWLDGIWNLLYTQQIVSAHEAGTTPLAFAWAANGSSWIVIPLCLIVAGIALVLLTRKAQSWHEVTLAGGAVFVGVLIMMGVGLRSYYNDPVYADVDPLLPQALGKLETEIRSGDAVLLNDSFFRHYLMNYYKGREPVYVLPDAPGERLGTNTVPEIVTDNPDIQAHPYTTLFLSRLAPQTRRWWFLTEFSPYSPGRNRPTELFFVRHYFPVREVVSEITLRLILFAPVSAPLPLIPPWPAHKLDADFGAARLVGYDLASDTVKAGTILPVSLLWRHDDWPADVPPFDCAVNITLINHDGVAVAQRAGLPIGGFGTMSQWIKGGYYRDNQGLALPDDLAPGEYELWALVYNWSNNTNLKVRNASVGAPADHIVVAKIQVVK